MKNAYEALPSWNCMQIIFAIIGALIVGGRGVASVTGSQAANAAFTTN